LGDDRSIEYLDLEDLIRLAALLLGDPPPVRDVGLLGSAAARPQTTAFGVDAYTNTWSKAAALLQSIVKNHALIDGNKPLGWMAVAVFLEINGITASDAGNEAVYDLVIDVAAQDRSIEQITAALQGLLADW
jgi:death-on-curing protein